MWTMLSGPGTANFINPTQPQTMVTVTQYGIYSFIWREMNAHMPNCYDQDTVQIEFLIAPEPDAGLDVAVCGKFAQLCATPSIPGGYWSVLQVLHITMDQMETTILRIKTRHARGYVGHRKTILSRCIGLNLTVFVVDTIQ